MKISSNHWVVKIARRSGAYEKPAWTMKPIATDLCTLGRQFGWGLLCTLGNVLLICAACGMASLMLYGLVINPAMSVYFWITASLTPTPDAFVGLGFLALIGIIAGVRALWESLSDRYRASRALTSGIVGAWAHSRLHKYCRPVTIVEEDEP